ncbi:FAD-binding domain-containing protein [Whalleya microplaca]|nr:FAD-binding domain-containing protein [Whalleya microplaca]
MRNLLTSLLFALLTRVECFNFPFESEQLTDADIGNFSAIAFGDKSTASPAHDETGCKSYPGTAGWPLDEEWAQLNRSLEGVLLKPVPPAAVCYDGPDKDEAQCNFLLRNTSTSRFYINNPLTVLNEWPEGNTCFASLQTEGLTCTQGGFPVYVVNATTVKQIQIAINFARNKNLRLTIKNTGHDFIGRSAGFGALSIWTHWLKDFEFLPQYSIGEYDGMAARVGSGLESWEMFTHMSIHNMTVLVAGGYTVGAYGGWMTGGGHSALASKYGLGADQPLSIEVVTADGRFVTADVNQNTDLFYALRGGGGSTYGIVTSAIVKAYPPIQVLSSSISFTMGSSNTSTTNDTATFWRGFDAFHDFGRTIVDAGGTAYSNLRATSTNPNNTTGFSFSADIEMPGLSAPALLSFIQPLRDRLAALGLPLPLARAPAQAANWQVSSRSGAGDAPGSSRFASRLLPYANFADAGAPLFAATQRAIRESVEAGYAFHGIHLRPTAQAGGWPGDNAANPAFREAIMHADLFDFGGPGRGATPEEIRDAHERLDAAMQGWRDVSPGAGAYMNEADLEEPEWQRAFFGEENYARLLGIKRDRDPWGLFYAPATVGSEDWVVVTADGLPTQNGPLCRAGLMSWGIILLQMNS